VAYAQGRRVVEARLTAGHTTAILCGQRLACCSNVLLQQLPNVSSS